MNSSPKLKNAIFVFSGAIALLLAYIGIIIPGFPAIPFIILAAYFFAHSSPRIYKWMMDQRVMKKLLAKSAKIDRRIFKGLMISQVWFSVAVAVITLAHTITARVLFIAGGIVLTILILIFMKTKRAQAPQ